MKTLKKLIKPVFRKLGRDLVVYNHLLHPVARRAKLLETYNTDLVLDIGANTGQYARGLRELGYRGKIVSFEPLSAAYLDLKKWADKDRNAVAVNSAIGNIDGNVEFNVAGNSTSSSILDILPEHTSAAPESAFIAKETVSLRRLDSVYNKYCSSNDSILLKIDAQGYEMHVLEGAKKVLDLISSLQIEISLVPLYKGQLLFIDVVSWLMERGFQLVDIEPIFVHAKTGEVLQVDCFFRAPTRP